VLLFQLHLQPLPTTTPLTFTAKSSTTRPTTAPTTTVTTTNGGACHCFASLSQSHETKHPNHNSHGGVVAHSASTCFVQHQRHILFFLYLSIYLFAIFIVYVKLEKCLVDVEFNLLFLVGNFYCH